MSLGWLYLLVVLLLLWFFLLFLLFLLLFLVEELKILGNKGLDTLDNTIVLVEWRTLWLGIGSDVQDLSLNCASTATLFVWFLFLSDRSKRLPALRVRDRGGRHLDHEINGCFVGGVQVSESVRARPQLSITAVWVRMLNFRDLLILCHWFNHSSINRSSLVSIRLRSIDLLH